MKKPFAFVAFLYIFVYIFTLPVLAADPRREAGTIYSNDDINKRSQITLTWKYAAGDTLFRTWDGRTWTEILFTPPAVGQQASVNSDVYVPYYANIYYEIRTQAYNPAQRNTGNNFVTIPVYPPLRNAHSEFSTNTDLCAACHITHAAEGPKLLKAVNNVELCKLCHGPGATGSRYSVWDGTVRLKDGGYAKSLGGPFAGGVAAWDFRPTTSSHLGGTGPQPGYFINYIETEPFTCLNLCHKPHSSSNSYRLLEDFGGSPIAAWVTNPTGTVQESAYYQDFNAAVCNTCHNRFYADPNSAHFTVGSVPEWGVLGDPDPYTGDFVYTHTTRLTDVFTWQGGIAAPTKPMPLLNDKTIFCLTCHYPHGTTKTETMFDNSRYDKNNDTIYDDKSTMLIRYDGICQNCHKK